MTEYIIAFEGNWRHFFIKQHVGLCWREKDGLKFGEYEVLLKGADADFCVYSEGKYIHVVCQDEKGSVLYLIYNGTSWKKSVLLESRVAKPYVKNFAMINLSGYINLVYTIQNKDNLMLVHQIIMEGSTPTVIDCIKNSPVPFCIFPHVGTDFSVFYVNKDGISGKQTYKWSKKAFLGFSETNVQGYSIKFIKNISGDRALASAIKKDGKQNNLASFILDEEGNISSESIIYSDGYELVVPVLSSYGDKTYAVWTEYGSVATSYLGEDDKWGKIMRYAKSSSGDVKLYVVCSEGNFDYYYGVPRGNDITLYGTHDILKKSPRKINSANRVSNIKTLKEKTDSSEADILKMQEEQIRKLYEELSAQKNKLFELTQRIEKIISAVPLASEDDIDRVLMN